MKPFMKLAGLSLCVSLSFASSAAERVISAGSGITELIVAMDATKKLVAVDMSSMVPESEKLEKLGYHRTLSAEGLLSVEPDLIIGSPEMGPKAALDIVRQADVDVEVLPQATDPEQLLKNVDTLASLLDTDSQVSDQLKQQINEQLKRIDELKGQLKRQPKVLFVLMRGDRAPKLGGGGTPADRIITLAGGSNGAGFDGYKTASEETLLSMNPDLILVNKPTMENADAAKMLVEKLPLLKFTPAGKQDRIVNLPTAALLGGLGPSALNSSEDLAKQLVEIQ
ncbi:heme/hemin ABC transporter substrate-binding protein [Ferrimonas aestuarii]|uniref:Hemin ABC transporter substrate-binding protein n=1 Tax=Ferrimonas aestuarii TaxID=2569539 RepID=A0A4V5NXQ7_9GAMM|nr:ABC transporter substrate-binding protein [Ferrimonas aestuarii]TKB53070.1 hemin ABC transporter substrate-binding protein [Ferrimonas aestuarii]